ncbi:uncharacterized protein Z518_06446 [Rhinocladiella mackenziei CBS 650.93]|uniref:Major facilitator superfamily (MFS) profile domain-containing protein n=1 Tax=Rhinocladiella mackenziei CBS 650.93 TaxID=1442369 RepID=A0A0D2IIL0_9EURO|nr:uncharacterized protein Z518_06446 [Rhinocladiella mackenziei CBS 650.93]KIX05574.1 hypothetical protein Z518_06446 [Rhinocladiella mackenziei CBS 650.93]
MAASDHKKMEDFDHVEMGKEQTHDAAPRASDLERVNTADLEMGYRLSIKTCLVIITFSLTWGVCTLANPVWGAFSDRFGKKWFIVNGGLIGIVGNCLAATAEATETIIVGQVLNGFGASLLLLVIPASMEVVPAKRRAYAQLIMGLVNGAFAIIGLVVAGAFAKMSLSGWRWVYYIGILLLVLGVVGVVTLLTWGGNAYPWKSARVIAMLAVGVVLLIVFGLYETFVRNDGLIDHRFMETRNFIPIVAVGFVDGMLLYGVNAFLPVEFCAIFTSDPVRVNVYLLPLNIRVIVGIFASTWLLGRTKHYRLCLIVSVFAIALFCGLTALATPSRVAMALVFTGLVGLGVGTTSVIPVVIISYAVPNFLIRTTETFLASMRALGGTIGITIFSSIYSNQMGKNLGPGVAAAAIKAGLPHSSAEAFVGAFLGGDTSALPEVSGSTPAIIGAAANAVKTISAQSFKYVWIALMAITVCAGIWCLFLKSVAAMMTVHVESALKQSALREHQLQILTKDEKHEEV